MLQQDALHYRKLIDVAAANTTADLANLKSLLEMARAAPKAAERGALGRGAGSARSRSRRRGADRVYWKHCAVRTVQELAGTLALHSDQACCAAGCCVGAAPKPSARPVSLKA